jgi:very-short-patch-repair endonuclease
MPLAPELAVLLHVGHDSVISHLSAAAMWGMAAHPAECVQLTVVGRGMRPRPGVEAHRVADLDRRDVRLRDGLPVTSPARTMIDVAGSADIETVQRTLSELRVRGLARDSELESAMERSPTRTGVARLRSILADEHGQAVTRSEAERRLLGLIKLAELPVPSCNVALHGFEVDALWAGRNLVLEVDGYASHGHHAAFERDRRRDQTLAAAGFRVIRVTWHQLQREPLALVARLAQALSAAAPGG